MPPESDARHAAKHADKNSLRMRRSAPFRRTAPPGCLALARWAGWSGVQVGRHVTC